MEDQGLPENWRIEKAGGVRVRLQDLGFESVPDLALLPRYFETARSAGELVHEASAATIAKLIREAGIDIGVLHPVGRKLGSVHENDFTWVGPTVFISSLLLTGNWAAVDIALGMIANYAAEFFQGRLGTRRARLGVVAEAADGTYTSLYYDGPPEGLRELSRIIARATRR